MATLERYNSFEELKNSEPVSKKKKKSSKETLGQKAFRKFGELLRKGIVPGDEKKK